ncbi:HTTM domain-containing protein [Bdellovibrio svalbardensis]|uniref:HTTM domain-containing protein n=1 Tax=Bdellovibrio svalbardensis TaxID=2972972 RepID=A0ABT6DKW4_9BACT|nr:HTTM domain-containing protein [Bdellovibrio svalbardensis]MDG0815748.1 HTTM domain-containing protein [Bdellovibrio svalbardensis]
MKLATITKSVQDFFFKPIQVQNVALMRIGIGVILLLNWYMIWSHLGVFYSDSGLVSWETMKHYISPNVFNLYFYFPNDPRTTWLFGVINLLGAIGVFLGLFTRTSIVLTFLTLVAFHERNIFILNSADLVLRNFLFFMLFSPAGEAYSLDRWIKVKLGSASEEPVLRRPWALRLMQLQFSFIYIATVLFKMKGTYWADGTAIYIATRLDEFFRIQLSILNSMFAIKMLTWGTLLVEFALGTLIWIRELKYWVLLAGVGLHLGIELTMSIPLFEWVMIVTMLCMVDPADINKVELWLRQKMRSRNRSGVVTSPSISVL